MNNLTAKSILPKKVTPPAAVPVAPSNPSNAISPAPPPKPVKKYACCFCDRAFSRSEHRSRHERSHTKERPFHCPKCPSTFVRRDLLLRHDRTVHGAVKRDQNKGTSKQIKNNGSSISSDYSNSISSTNSNGSNNMTSIANILDKTLPSASATTEAHNSRKRRRSIANKQNFKDQDAFLNVFSIKQKIKHEPDGVSVTVAAPTTASSLISSVPSDTATYEPHKISSNNNYSNNANANHTNKYDTDNQSTGSPLGPSKIRSSSMQMLRSEHFSKSQTPLTNHKPRLCSPVVAPASSVPIAASTGQIIPPSVANFTIPQLGAAFSLPDLLSQLDTHHNEHLHALSLTLSKLQLNRYLSAYFYYFHPTLPFLHTNSFVPTDQRLVYAPLLFGVCSIGALLCCEKHVSVLLHNASRFLAATHLGGNVLSPVTAASTSGGNTPLSLLQTLLTHIVYCAWFGDVRGFEYLETLRPTVAALVRAALAKQLQRRRNRSAAATATKSRSEFIETESVLRTYYAAFILFGSLTVVFDCEPLPLLMPNNIPEDATLPCSEMFWNSSLSVSEFSKHPHHAPKFQTVLRELVRPDGVDSNNNLNAAICNGLSPMAIRVLGTALFLEVWSANAAAARTTADDRALLQQRLYLFGRICNDPEPGQGQLISQFLVNSPPIAMALVIDATNSSSSGDGGADIIHRFRTHQHPLVVDSYILLIVAELRVHVDFAPVKKAIQSHAPHEIASAAYTAFLRLMPHHSLQSSAQSSFNFNQQQKHFFERPDVLVLVRKCFEFIKIILLPGLNLSISFFEASANWLSTESILNLFETSLMLIMWCHYHHYYREQTTQKQKSSSGADDSWAASSELYEEIKKILRDSGPPPPPADDVAAAAMPVMLCLVMADFLHACREAWGIAELLGSALRDFAYQLQQSAISPVPPTLAPPLPLPTHYQPQYQHHHRHQSSARVAVNDDTSTVPKQLPVREQYLGHAGLHQRSPQVLPVKPGSKNALTSFTTSN